MRIYILINNVNHILSKYLGLHLLEDFISQESSVITNLASYLLRKYS